MRPATTVLVRDFWKDLGENFFQEPRVDFGGAESSDQFREIFSKYQVYDIRNLPGVDKVVDGRNMWSCGRVPANSIGTFMSFDTFEHIFEIQDVIEQISKVVFPGGVVFIGVPWMYPFHDPSGDFWRFSPQALERMFAKDFEKQYSGFYDQTNGIVGSSFYIGRRKTGTREFRVY